MTVASNENQSQAQLLRHGELNWVTRGVFLGYQRNYLELQVDDLFLGDDAWDPDDAHDQLRPGHGQPHDAGRRRPGRRVVEGARPAHRLRLQRRRQRALQGRQRDDDRSAGRRLRRPGDARRLRLRQPHLRPPEPRLLDVVLHRQGDHRQRRLGPPARPARSTPPRSSPASTPASPTPGPATRARSTRRASTTSTPAAGGTIPAGTYDYAITAQSPAGETTASVVPGVAVAAGQKVTASFNAVCHAISYNLYRSAAGANSWTQVGTLARSATAATDDGTNPIALTITDTGAAGTSKAPPAANGAALAPYGQNPNLPAPGSTAPASGTSPPTPRRPIPRTRSTSTAR